MGCAASSDRADVERRRRLRERALGHSEASTTGLLLTVSRQDHDPAAAAWRRRGCKVAPEPCRDRQQQEEEEEPPAMPGSPSFRYYCQQKAAVVDALVAEDEARRDSDVDGSVRITAETSHQGPKRYELPADDTSRNKIVEASKPKQVTKWLKFRGLAIVAAAWNNLFSRHRSSASTPPAAAAAKSHPTGPAPAPVAAGRSRT